MVLGGREVEEVLERSISLWGTRPSEEVLQIGTKMRRGREKRAPCLEPER